MAGIFNTAERAARRAERQRIFAAEREQTRIREKRYRIEERGYAPSDGRINDVGGYGISLQDDSTVTIGDPELGDVVRGPLAGARAHLESPYSQGAVRARGFVEIGHVGVVMPMGRRDRRRFLVVKGRGFEAVAVVDGSDEVHLRQWVAWFNRRAGAA